MKRDLATISAAVICVLSLALMAGPAAASARQNAQAQGASQSVPSDKAMPAGKQEEKMEVEQPGGKAFASPEAAAAALYYAARNEDTQGLMAILGPDSKDVVQLNEEDDATIDQEHMFADKYHQMHRLVKEADGTVALYVGAENWPLPIPLVQYKGSWYFDTELGKQEILYRQLGRNEIAALEVSHEVVGAEKEYFGMAHAYTAKFMSSGNAHDGLYWKGGESQCPVGPYLAQAGVTDTTANRKPFHGYFYRVLLGGGAANNFVVVAFPAVYRTSGVMTFITDANGDAYEKDLGGDTAKAAMQISSQQDASWKKVE